MLRVIPSLITYSTHSEMNLFVDRPFFFAYPGTLYRLRSYYSTGVQDMISPLYPYGYSSFEMVTNGLGIVREITFYNKDFLDAHPEIVVGKKSNSPGLGQVR